MPSKYMSFRKCGAWRRESSSVVCDGCWKFHNYSLEDTTMIKPFTATERTSKSYQETRCSKASRQQQTTTEIVYNTF